MVSPGGMRYCGTRYAVHLLRQLADSVDEICSLRSMHFYLFTFFFYLSLDLNRQMYKKSGLPIQAVHFRIS